MSIITVKQACEPAAPVWNDSLAEQIAELNDLRDGRIDPDAFFRRNHFTEGMERLLYNGFKRLSGESEVGAYYLSQAMGGGKTHSLIAFALLAANPSVRARVAPRLHPLANFETVHTVVFNGHDGPENFLWGFIAERLGDTARFARFWKDGARAPGHSDWVELIGEQPTLILLDELPSYLQMAQAQAVGATTLAEVSIGALERLFAALPHLPRTCILLTNLRDDIYRSGSNAVKTVIDTLTKQAGKYAEEITPVRQNSGEIFQIIRKQLFDDLPDEARVDALAEAYVEALNRAKKLDAIATAPETFLARIRESYPFHPALRDIVARFKENSGYQQTRALIRILRHAVRAVWRQDDPVFLIGLQHLDLNVPGAMEEIRKINPNFSNAIARDIADNGNALAERLDDTQGNGAATAVAKLLLMASLSSARDPILGLRDTEVVETLIDPLTQVSELQGALDGLLGRAWYLFVAPGERRIYVGQTANVLAQIQEIAAGLTEEVVDRELRVKLREVFRPTRKLCYHEVVFALPALDELRTVEDQVRLVILEQSARKLPPEFIRWWEQDERPNRVLVLTADSNAVQTLRDNARQFHATRAVQESVQRRHGVDSQQYREASEHLEKIAKNFLSAVREAFKTLVFPSSRGLREVTDFEMRFEHNDYDGEQQILDTLIKRGKLKSSQDFDENLNGLRLDAEEELFDARAVPEGELRRKAAARPSWVWLPPGGLEKLIRESVARGFWRHANGIVEKGPFPRITDVRVAAQAPDESGLYELAVTPIDADVVYVSETGVPDTDSQRVQGGRWRTYAGQVWFLAVDSRGEASTGAPVEWQAPFALTPLLASTPNGYRLTATVLPRDAEVRVSFEGANPRDGQVLGDGLLLPEEVARVRLIARLGERWSAEQSLPVPKDQAHEDPEAVSTREVREDLPVLLKNRQQAESTRQSYTWLEVMQNLGGGVELMGGKLELRGEQGDQYLDLSFGDGVRLSAGELLDMVARYRELVGGATVILRWHRLRFDSGRAFKRFAEEAALDWERLEWDQDDVPE